MSEVAAAPELVSAPAPMPTENLRTLLARARAAAREIERPDEPLAWSAALAAAPWPKGAPPAFEREFRAAFAEGLVKRGVAKKAAPQGKASSKQDWREKQTKLPRYLVTATQQEFDEWDKRAAAAGLSRNAWIRRKLAQPD